MHAVSTLQSQSHDLGKVAQAMSLAHQVDQEWEGLLQVFQSLFVGSF